MVSLARLSFARVARATERLEIRRRPEATGVALMRDHVVHVCARRGLSSLRTGDTEGSAREDGETESLPPREGVPRPHVGVRAVGPLGLVRGAPTRPHKGRTPRDRTGTERSQHLRGVYHSHELSVRGAVCGRAHCAGPKAPTL